MSMQWLWWAPFVAALAHITEEFVYPGAFAKWERGRRPRFRDAIASRFHPLANAVFIALCLRAGLAGTGSVSGLGGIPAEYNAAFWLFLVALMFLHAVLHVEGSIRTQRASPGLWTAVSLYVPLAIVGFWRFYSRGLAPASIGILAALAWVSCRRWPFLFDTRHVGRAGLR